MTLRPKERYHDVAPVRVDRTEHVPSPLVKLLHEVRCGHHSGFPPCCVEFYARTWRYMPEWRRVEICAQDMRELWAGLAPHAQYVQCPDCRERGYAEKLIRCWRPWGEQRCRTDAYPTNTDFVYPDRDAGGWLYSGPGPRPEAKLRRWITHYEARLKTRVLRVRLDSAMKFREVKWDYGGSL